MVSLDGEMEATFKRLKIDEPRCLIHIPFSPGRKRLHDLWSGRLDQKGSRMKSQSVRQGVPIRRSSVSATFPRRSPPSQANS